MSKMIDNNSARKMFSAVNPFFLRMPNNPDEYCIFNRPSECYYSILLTFFKNCPKGFIELPFILWMIYPFKKYKEIKEMKKAMMDLKVPDIAVINYDTKEASIYFEGFFTALHSICGTDMNHEAFKQALGYSKHIAEVLKTDLNAL